MCSHQNKSETSDNPNVTCTSDTMLIAKSTGHTALRHFNSRREGLSKWDSLRVFISLLNYERAHSRQLQRNGFNNPKSLSDSTYSRTKKAQQWQVCMVFFTYMYYLALWNLKLCSADVKLQERLLTHSVYCNTASISLRPNMFWGVLNI